MKTLLLAAAATLSLGAGAAFAQCAPCSVRTPLGQPWTKQKLAEQQAARDRATPAKRPAAPPAQRNPQMTTSNAHGG
jgi:hypothetical protein